jgi:hypothetical protein
MSLLKTLQDLFSPRPTPEERDEAYLADAVDIYDLEHRMRELDRRDAGRFPGAFGNCFNHTRAYYAGLR